MLTVQSPAKIPTKPGQRTAEPRLTQIARARLEQGYGNLALAFEPNLGQSDPQVRFLARGGGMTAFFTDSETVMVLSRNRSGDRQTEDVEQAVVRMQLAGADRPRRLTGTERLPGVSNYFVGNNPAKWRTGVPHYARIQYEDVYPGIDVVWYGNQRRLEYDFVVAPGADPKQIQVVYQGVESLRVDGNGDLVLRTALGVIRQQKPRVYQEAQGKRVEVAARYRVSAANQVSFELARYDGQRELRIDPVVLAYSTYLGSGGKEIAYAVAVDAAGSAYVTGYAMAAGFPTQSPYQSTFHGGTYDAFVTKLKPEGNALVYSTYLGGGNFDVAAGIAVDGSGAAYLTGYTASNDFPTRSSYQAALLGDMDAFVTKLNPAGSALAYSTYLGGSNNEWGAGIAVDNLGAAYVTGYTKSTNFPAQSPYQSVLGGAQDGFVTKLNPAGSALAYSTYLGGSGADYAYGIAVDAAGAAYVTGSTPSANFPTQLPYQSGFQGGASDAFVTKLAAAGNALAYSTYLGGNADDQGVGIAVDASGSAYVAGWTKSAGFPVQSAYQASIAGGKDAFLTKLTPAGGALVYSTFLGGSADDSGSGIALDPAGSAFVAGSTGSTNFPTQSADQAALQGSGSEVFVSKVTPAGNALAYSTYLGGSAVDQSYGIAVDTAGAAYVVGYSASADFPLQSAFQPVLQGGSYDAFVSKLQFGSQMAVDAIANAASGAAGGVAPGEIVAIYGAGLGPAAGVANSGWDPATGKLPTVLGGTSVTFDGQAAPLFYVVAGQINAQVPYEVEGKASTSVVVTYNGSSSAPTNVPVAAAHPGVFVYNDRAIVTNNANGALITAASPIARGGDVVVWATGPGVVAPAVSTGAPVTTLSYATNPQAWIGGSPVEVQFAGMTPGLAGLMQVNLHVPADAPTGSSVPLRISINGLAVQAYIGGGVTTNLTLAIQ